MAAVSGGSIPFTRYEVTDTTAFPARTHGKIFLTDDGFDYECSGTAVTSPVESVVFTAGHCVHDTGGGGWAEYLAFVPGYRNGASPYGVFPARTLASNSEWIDYENYNYDYGGAIVGANSGGRSLEAAVGSRGIAFNMPREQTFQAWGYPGDPPFNGGASVVCESGYGGDDPSPDHVGPPPMGIGCDMTAGASGGGWVISSDYLNSLTSFVYEFYPNVLFGPYFGDGASRFYDLICCDPADKPPPPPSPPPPLTVRPPNTFFIFHPTRRIFVRRARFAFQSNVVGSWFKCLYAAGWRRCRSPQVFRGLTPGAYVFKVRAIKDGRQDPTPAVWHFRVLR